VHCDRDVDEAVAGDVAERELAGIDPHRVVHCREREATQVSQDGHRARGAIRDDEVVVEVVVEVGDLEIPRVGADGEARAGHEGSGVVHDQTDRVGVLKGNRDVDVAIAVEVARDRRVRARAGADEDVDGRPEGPVAVVEEEGDAVRSVVRDDEIEIAVLVEVADGGGVGLRADGIGRGTHRELGQHRSTAEKEGGGVRSDRFGMRMVVSRQGFGDDKQRRLERRSPPKGAIDVPSPAARKAPHPVS
jgi:hypothetical protein